MDLIFQLLLFKLYIFAEHVLQNKAIRIFRFYYTGNDNRFHKFTIKLKPWELFCNSQLY